ncbi:PhzF family phenazine biosynthesis protein [Marinobacter sp. NFXS9]|uniref:PhzF family phenazine biosynthesis protein n=1 Tax=Marinobacter sp. NFXS9 TaxID=2818433 RepID=UPI0032DED91B
MSDGSLYRYTAFSHNPEGGNPAGVWIGEDLPTPETMQRIAADVGFSETAFIAPATGTDRIVRYYSPEAEVSFCGHATIAAGVVLGELEGEGTYQLVTVVGKVPVEVRAQDGLFEAALTSVEPKYEPAPSELLSDALDALGWQLGELDASLPPVRAYAGAWHLVLAVRDEKRLATLDYDFERLKALMLKDGLTTLQLIWREAADVFVSRNPFPVGGVVEDPATGAAAAALGGYLRNAGIVPVPYTLHIRQGEAMGRPSRLTVRIPEMGGIVVSGTAVPMERVQEIDC